MGNKEFRLGLVGCGGIATRHGISAQATQGKVRIVACCDVRESAARAWADKFGAERIYADYSDMIRQEDLDGVLLATWPTQHREQVGTCLRLGVKNILCEKALTLTGDEAVDIWALVQTHKAFLMEGFMYRHHPAIRKLESLLSGGEPGPVDNIRACFSNFDPETTGTEDPSRNWRQRKECGGGVPYDFACYCVNACGHFAGGLPVRAFSSGGFSSKYGTVNRLYGLIEYDNGRAGLIESSSKSGFSQELQISCRGGILDLPLAWTIYEESRITWRRSIGWAHLQDESYVVEKADAYQLQLENFAGVACGQTTPLVPLIQSVVNTFAIEALITSLQERRAVDIAIPQPVANAFCAQVGVNA